jgi:hypothetical protein
VVQPAQEKPPPEPQLLLLEEDVAPEKPEANAATVDSFLWVSLLWQAGQTGLRSTSEKRTIFSNTTPQSLQRYSYKGIRKHLDLYSIGEYTIIEGGVKVSMD